MKAWENFLALQEIELGRETVNKWLRPLKIVRYDACNLYLESNNSFQVTWFEEYMREKVKARLLNNNNKQIKVHVKVQAPQGTKKATSKPQEHIKKISSQFWLTFDTLDPNCTFPNYVPTGGNDLLLKVLGEVCSYDMAKHEAIPPSGNALTFNPVYIYGKAGVGKTHLLMSIVSTLRRQGKNVLFVRAETFTDHVVSAIRAGEMSAFREAYRNIDALVIDDVHIFSKRAATQEEFFHTFNTLHLAGKQIILSANCAPCELTNIEPRLVSRFEWGIALKVQPPSQDDLRKIVIQKSNMLQFELNPSVIDFLIENFKSGTKSIVKSIEALILRCHNSKDNRLLSSTALTIPVVKHHLKDLLGDEQQLAITPDKIIRTVAENFGIKKEDILGKSQNKECTLPRQIAMHLCRSHLKMPYVKIGDLFGRDHSTVISSIKKIDKNLNDNDANTAPYYQKITNSL